MATKNYGADKWLAGVGGGAVNGASAGVPFGLPGVLIGGAGGAILGAAQTAEQEAAYKAQQEQQAALAKELASKDVYDRMLQQNGLQASAMTQEAKMQARLAANRAGLTPMEAAALESRAVHDVNTSLAAAMPGNFLAAQQADLARKGQVLNEYQAAQTLANNSAPNDYSQLWAGLTQAANAYGGMKAGAAAAPAVVPAPPIALTGAAEPTAISEQDRLVQLLNPWGQAPATGAPQTLAAPAATAPGNAPSAAPTPPAPAQVAPQTTPTPKAAPAAPTQGIRKVYAAARGGVGDVSKLETSSLLEAGVAPEVLARRGDQSPEAIDFLLAVDLEYGTPAAPQMASGVPLETTRPVLNTPVRILPIDAAVQSYYGPGTAAQQQQADSLSSGMRYAAGSIAPGLVIDNYTSWLSQGGQARAAAANMDPRELWRLEAQGVR